MQRVKITRREFVRLGTLAVAGGIAAACAPQEAAVTEEPAAPTAAPVVSDDPRALLPQGHEAQLEWWIHHDHFLAVSEAMKKGVERFTEVNPGVSCEVLEVPDTTTKVQAALVGKQPKPNIFIGRPSSEISLPHSARASSSLTLSS